MMNLAEYRRTGARLADYLPWAALVGKGVVLNKDGSFQRSRNSADPTSTVRCRPNWSASLGASTTPSAASARAGASSSRRSGTRPRPIPEARSGRRLGADRCRAEGQLRGSRHALSSRATVLTIVYLPPPEDAARAETWLYEGREQTGVNPWEILRGFVDRTDRVLALLDGFMPECRWLDDDETLTYLHSTVSTKRHHVGVPETPMYLDALLADQPLAGGLEPRLGDTHLRILTIVGFPARQRQESSTS